MDPITGGILVFLVVFVASLVLIAGFGVAVSRRPEGTTAPREVAVPNHARRPKAR